jgi:protein involved in polysaccharide export with SLBB domain
MAGNGPQTQNADLTENYVVLCPDVIQVSVSGRPELRIRAALGPDGHVDLGELGKPRVEGRPVVGIAHIIEQEAGLQPGQVHVRVEQFNSQPIYVFGEVVGWQRPVPYLGPETVLDLLKRVGGLTAGGAPDDVYVIRPHITEGSRPQVFHVDLRAIVLKGDQRTNLCLQPFDQVHVGESHRAKWKHCIPPILHSLFARERSGARNQESGLRSQESGARDMTLVSTSDP